MVINKYLRYKKGDVVTNEPTNTKTPKFNCGLCGLTTAYVAKITQSDFNHRTLSARSGFSHLFLP
ncbi:hypothetical protein LJA01_09740 [Lactobacillus japonicus]|nr:hypothetical protein LJA01_09740 [Lactobacillus japonicus]